MKFHQFSWSSLPRIFTPLQPDFVVVFIVVSVGNVFFLMKLHALVAHLFKKVRLLRQLLSIFRQRNVDQNFRRGPIPIRSNRRINIKCYSFMLEISQTTVRMERIPQLVIIVVELSISKAELGDDVSTHNFHLVIRKDLQVTNIRHHRIET